MAPKSYAELKKQVAEMQAAEDVLKKEIERLTAEPGAEGSDEANAALEAKTKAEAEVEELKKEIERLTAEVNLLSQDAPQKVVLERPYAFFDEDGTFRSWDVGEITNEAHIEILRGRGVI